MSCPFKALGDATFNNGALDCSADTGYSFHVISTKPTPDEIVRICKSSACMRCIQAMRQAAPSECTLIRGFALYGDIFTPITTECKRLAVVPTTPAPTPAPSPATAFPVPVPPTSAPGMTATTPPSAIPSANVEARPTPTPSSSSATEPPSSTLADHATPSPSGNNSVSSPGFGNLTAPATTRPSSRADTDRLVSEAQKIANKQAETAMSVGTIIGISVIVVLGVVGIAAFIFLASQRRKNAKHRQDTHAGTIAHRQTLGQRSAPPSRTISPAYVGMQDRPQARPSTDQTVRQSAVDPPRQSNMSSNNNSWSDPLITSARIPLDQIHLGKLLSRGAFGEVYQGQFKNESVAVKRLLPERRKDMVEIEAFLGEARLLSTLFHERIIRFVGVAWDSLTDLCIVTEFMAGGDLRSLLLGYERAGAPTGFTTAKVRIALHVVHGLSYLHSIRPAVVHRDLKSKNVLLSSDLEAKLTDFGVSRERADHTMTAGVGSSLWMAPEVMLGQRYDEKADIFSLGVMLSELDTHRLPYAQTNRPIPDASLLQLVALGRLSVAFEDTRNPDLVALGRACVDLEPACRPTAAELLPQLHGILQSFEAML